MPSPAFASPSFLPHHRSPRRPSTSNRHPHLPTPTLPQPRPLPTHCLLDATVAVVLSHHEASALARLQPSLGASGSCSPSAARVAHGDWSVNCGRDRLSSVVVTSEGLSFGGAGERGGESDAEDGDGDREEPCVHVTFRELAKMAKKGRVGAYQCFCDGVTAPERIAGLSQLTKRAASLQPHVPGKPPTVALGGFGMHRFKGTDPGRDTEAKIDALRSAGPLRGRALDVCTGLGYTAIALSEIELIDSVSTIELDPVISDVISPRNPWSEPLFRSEKITRMVGDATAVLPTLHESSFDLAIHDPPAQAMGGELYSQQFYRELARVLAPRARLFHYIGDPGSAESGRLFRGVSERLKIAGFREVTKFPPAFGVVAVKA